MIDLNRLGALVTKTVSRDFRAGNPPPRVAEVEGGMINSIGLPTKGIEYFLEHQLPDYKRFTPPLVGQISATTIEDFEAMARDVSTARHRRASRSTSPARRATPSGGNFALHEEHTYRRGEPDPQDDRQADLVQALAQCRRRRGRRQGGGGGRRRTR